MGPSVILATVPAPVEEVQTICLLTERIKARLSLLAFSSGLTTCTVLIRVVAMWGLIPIIIIPRPVVAIISFVNVCEGYTGLKVVRENPGGVLALRDTMAGRGQMRRLF